SCLCLISQRPKRLSTTALSQCNSKIVLNIKNPYDLKHLMDSSESITTEYAKMISSLGVGEMLLMGNAVVLNLLGLWLIRHKHDMNFLPSRAIISIIGFEIALE
ncbi:unnamed protein product, partial [marine sediment metagenome]